MASYGSQQYQQQQQQQQQYQQQQQQMPLSPGLGPGQTQLLLQSPKKPGLPPESGVVPPPPPPVPLNMEGKTCGGPANHEWFLKKPGSIGIVARKSPGGTETRTISRRLFECNITTWADVCYRICSCRLQEIRSPGSDSVHMRLLSRSNSTRGGARNPSLALPGNGEGGSGGRAKAR